MFVLLKKRVKVRIFIITIIIAIIIIIVVVVYFNGFSLILFIRFAFQISLLFYN